MHTDAAGPELAAVGVRFAHLFGSRALGTARTDSDADIAVATREPLDLLTEAAHSPNDWPRPSTSRRSTWSISAGHHCG